MFHEVLGIWGPQGPACVAGCDAMTIFHGMGQELSPIALWPWACWNYTAVPSPVPAVPLTSLRSPEEPDAHCQWPQPMSMAQKALLHLSGCYLILPACAVWWPLDHQQILSPPWLCSDMRDCTQMGSPPHKSWGHHLGPQLPPGAAPLFLLPDTV